MSPGSDSLGFALSHDGVLRIAENSQPTRRRNTWDPRRGPAVLRNVAVRRTVPPRGRDAHPAVDGSIQARVAAEGYHVYTERPAE